MAPTKRKKATTKTAKTKRASTAKKPSACKKASTAKKESAAKKAGGKTATIDRRSSKDRRTTPDRRVKDEPVAAERRTLQRRAKVNRRRQIDPTTCERDYTPEEIEFMNAMDEYKRASGRMFPTCSEVLEVIVKLGYEKRPATASVAQHDLGAASNLLAQQVGESTAT